MKSGTQVLAEKLLGYIFTASALQEVSISLEELAQNKHFKDHASNIINDSSLLPAQKKNQLNYLFRSIEAPLVYNFLTDLIGQEEFWLFDHEKIDYFDEFVQTFQLETENIQLLHLTTAVQVSETFIRSVARDLTHSLGKKVILSIQVNPSILGGVQIKIDNYVFDYSLRTKFQQFQKEWLASLDKQAKLTGRYDMETMSTET